MLRVTLSMIASHRNVIDNSKGDVCIYVRMISLNATDLTTHVQVVTDRYDTPTDPNA